MWVRLLSTWAILLTLAALPALAQPQPGVGPGGAGMQRPTFSPYLNLLNRGTSPAINYLGIVRPQLQAQQQFGQLTYQNQLQNQSIANNADQIAIGADPFLPYTGTVAVFNNTGTYFNRHPVTGAARGASGSFGAGLGLGGFGNNRSLPGANRAGTNLGATSSGRSGTPGVRR